MPIGGASAKVDSGGARELNHALDRRSSTPEWAPDGRAILYMAFDRGKSVLYRVSLQGGASVALIDRKAHVGPFSMARDGLIAAGISDPLTPPEVYRFRPDADLQPLTTLNSATTAPLQLVAPEAFAFRGAGGADVSAWYYPAAGSARPAAASIPLILSIHSGPHAAHGYRFNAAVQVRPHGSADGDAEDVMAAVDQLLKSKPEIDVERVGVTGPRESGVMHEIATLATRFKAIVSISADPDDRPAAPASDLTIPTLVVHAVHDPAHDLDRMERTLAWFDRFLGSRPSASR
jgi:dipeptidyl aminopeptidase/acylaminoacyl peptidase